MSHLTVGELRSYIEGMDDDLPVVLQAMMGDRKSWSQPVDFVYDDKRLEVRAQFHLGGTERPKPS